MRRQSVRTEVIALLADGHWWTVGELADSIDCYSSAVRRALADLEHSGAVERFDDERPTMFGWCVSMKALERDSA